MKRAWLDSFFLHYADDSCRLNEDEEVNIQCITGLVPRPNL